MRDRKANLLSAASYAVFFVVFMVWWTGSDAASILMLAVCGAFNGVVWYWLFNSGARWIIRRNNAPRTRNFIRRHGSFSRSMIDPRCRAVAN